MDQQQTKDPVQLLSWLDEQHREDRRQLADLRKVAETQEQELEDLAQRFEEMERRLAGTQAQLVKFSEIEAALQGLKNEITSVLEETEARLQTRDARLEARLEVQDPKLTNLSKALGAVQGTLDTLENRIEDLPPRIDSQVQQTAGLARDIEEFEKRFNQTQARLAQLNERLSNQVDSTATLAKQLEHLEGRLSNTQAQLVKFPQIEAALQETKRELVFMINELEEQRRKEVRETAQLRESERKDIWAALDNIHKELPRISPLEERTKDLAAEDKRLRNLISQHEQRIPPLREQLDKHAHRLSYLEEERPKTSHRIDQLEVQIPPLDEAIEENAGKIRFLQEWAQRSAEKIDELKRFEDQMEQWRVSFIEEIRQGEQRRDRRLSDWEHILAEHAEIIDEWRETLRRYEIAHQDSRRRVGVIETIAEELERDQAEVAEQQRLADERLQRELVAWQDENEKRWRLFLKKRDYDWEQQVKRDAEQNRRLAPLESWREVQSERFTEELDRLDENDRRILARLVSLIRRLEETIEPEIAHRKKRQAALQEEMQASDVLVTRSSNDRPRRPAQRSARDKE